MKVLRERRQNVFHRLPRGTKVTCNCAENMDSGDRQALGEICEQKHQQKSEAFMFLFRATGCDD